MVAFPYQLFNKVMAIKCFVFLEPSQIVGDEKQPAYNDQVIPDTKQFIEQLFEDHYYFVLYFKRSNWRLATGNW
jgi:hypothetical protein